MERVPLNENGFTLLEALFAILILSVMLLGLIPAFMKAYNINQELALREAAIEIANDRIERLRSEDFSTISSNSTTVMRQIKKASIPYSVNTTVTSLYGGELKSVTVRVFWNYRGDQKSYNATTIIGDISG